MPLVSTFGNLSARAFGLGAAAKVFSPLSLFAAGEQGVWYDPSDLTTMFEDSAGTTPVHTPGNGVADSPVGLLLDKHSNGVGTNGAARYNLLTYSEQFNNAAWGTLNVTVTANQATAPDGTTTADMLSETATNTQHSLYQNPGVVSGVNYTASVALKQGTQRYAVLSFATGSTNQVRFAAVVDLQTGTITQTNTLNSPTGTSSSITSLGSGWYRVTITQTSTTTAGYLVVAMSNTGTPTTFISGTLDPQYTGSTSNNIYIWGADLRLSSQSSLTPTYQPITSSWAATMAGNHATQSTSTARPTLSARYNLLTYSEQFNNAVWSKFGTGAVTANQATAPDGTSTADKLQISSSNGGTYQQFTDSTYSGVTMVASICAKKATQSDYGHFCIYAQVSTTVRRYAILVNLTNGAFVSAQNSATAQFSSTSYSITDLGGGWYRISLTAAFPTGTFTNYGMFAEPANATNTYNTDLLDITNNTSGNNLYIWGADLRVSNDGVGLPAYQRIADANTYDSTGFPYYIKADGVDDALTTSSFAWGTNRITLSLGIRNFNSGADNSFIEFYTGTVSGAWALYRSSVTNVLNFYSNGGSGTDVKGATLTVPSTEIVTASGYTAGSTSIRENGTQTGSNASTQGSGNYGTYPIWMLKRYNGQPSNMRLYGVIARGASSTSTEISNTENWLNTKAKIY